MKKSNVIDLLEIILGIASFVYYFVCVAYEAEVYPYCMHG